MPFVFNPFTGNLDYTTLTLAQMDARYAPLSSVSAMTHYYQTNIGDASSTSLTVTHNLNNQFPLVLVYDNATSQTIEIGITSTGVNTISIGPFGTAPTTNAYKAMVVG